MSSCVNCGAPCWAKANKVLCIVQLVNGLLLFINGLVFITSSRWNPAGLILAGLVGVFIIFTGIVGTVHAWKYGNVRAVKIVYLINSIIAATLSLLTVIFSIRFESVRELGIVFYIPVYTLLSLQVIMSIVASIFLCGDLQGRSKEFDNRAADHYGIVNGGLS